MPVAVECGEILLRAEDHHCDRDHSHQLQETLLASHVQDRAGLLMVSGAHQVSRTSRQLGVMILLKLVMKDIRVRATLLLEHYPGQGSLP